MPSRVQRWTFFSRQAATAACLACFIILPLLAQAQGKRFRPQPEYVQIGQPDQAEGRRILEDFRKRGFPGQFYWEFDLRVMPRRGAERTVPGHLWGGTNELGPIWRVEIAPGVVSTEERLLIQNGPTNATWRWRKADGKTVQPLGVDALFQPLGETDLTAFELQMPFIFWNDFVFEGTTKLRGRPAYVFLLYPPAPIVEKKPALTGVRIYVDTQFRALVQATQIGAEGRLLKSVSVLEFKKINEDWILKSIDVRNEETGNKTRFIVTGAAMNLDFSPALFAPAELSERIQAPAIDKIVRLAP